MWVNIYNIRNTRLQVGKSYSDPRNIDHKSSKALLLMVVSFNAGPIQHRHSRRRLTGIAKSWISIYTAPAPLMLHLVRSLLKSLNFSLAGGYNLVVWDRFIPSCLIDWSSPSPAYVVPQPNSLAVTRYWRSCIVCIMCISCLLPTSCGASQH